MSRTRRIFLLAALIVFGLIAPVPTSAALTHCTSPWAGTNDTMKSTCRFLSGGDSFHVFGTAVAGPMAHLKVELINADDPFQTVIVSCSNAGSLFTQCSGGVSLQHNVIPARTEMLCRVSGVAVTGVFSCRTV